MKITKTHNDGFVNFCNLKVGDTFFFDGEIYLKFDVLDLDDGDCVNAICLNDGGVESFSADTRVKIVQAELLVDY